ncbi:DNA cytosine methyltransferase [Streptomyces sp. NPDC091268]|uniref:DNA cytosine methyltransferase n=1 Tax=Streptomyces sp. NPDC091268 TaxID=3365979 RepID=UPI00382B9E2E
MLTYIDFFAGVGGSSLGASLVPGVRPVLAANHWDRAIASHSANFPDTDHFQGDLHDADVARFPAADLFWASPECPKWSNARGKRRDFDKQPDLFGETLPEPAADRSRALMWDVPRYLAATGRRGKPVLAGVVENVIEVRAWDLWQAWRDAIRALGYDTKLIALNSMHARPVRTVAAPQSRDRLYLAYWHRSLGRTPDWDKWLRPSAWCPSCEEHVRAVQVFKNPRRDMGRYRQQYVYRCPRVTCRNAILEPDTLPAAAAIDWALPGQRIGDRAKPLADKTLARIQAGLDKFARPMVVPAGGTWRDTGAPLDEPMPTRTTRENDGLATPPLLIPVEGRDGKEPASANSPLRTQTARNETGLAWLPFMVTMRGGGDQLRGRPIHNALGTVSANGNHHGLVAPANMPALIMRNNGSRGHGGEHCTSAAEFFRTMTTAGHQSLVTWDHLLIPYYGNGAAKPTTEPIGTLSTRDRYALAGGGSTAIEDVLFRMLEPAEIGRAMAFHDAYTVLGNKRERVRQYGNAVTPPVAEILVSALVETVTGILLDREAVRP